MVAIVTALLRMPLVGNKKRMPLTTCADHGEREHNNTHKDITVLTCIYSTLTLRSTQETHTHMQPPTQRTQLTTRHMYGCHIPAAHTGAPINADVVCFNLPETCNQSIWGQKVYKPLGLLSSISLRGPGLFGNNLKLRLTHI